MLYVHKGLMVLLSILVVCLVVASLVTVAKREAIRTWATGHITGLEAVYKVNTQIKAASLTFDVVWGADQTEYILDILDDYDIKATFFVAGMWAEKHPEILQQIISRGHDVGNYSYSYPHMCTISEEMINEEFANCSAVLKETGGIETDLFRPPFGEYDVRVLRLAQEFGLKTIMWSVDSEDWDPGGTTERIVNRVLNRVHAGAIILFHDSAPETPKALPIIIHGLLKEGYTLLTVSELLEREGDR